MTQRQQAAALAQAAHPCPAVHRRLQHKENAAHLNRLIPDSEVRAAYWPRCAASAVLVVSTGRPSSGAAVCREDATACSSGSDSCKMKGVEGQGEGRVVGQTLESSQNATRADEPSDGSVTLARLMYNRTPPGCHCKRS